jgi:hypothetical protein
MCHSEYNIRIPFEAGKCRVSIGKFCRFHESPLLLTAFRHELQSSPIGLRKSQFLPEVAVVTGNGIQYHDGRSDSIWREFGGVVNQEMELFGSFNDVMIALTAILMSALNVSEFSAVLLIGGKPNYHVKSGCH